MNSAIRLIESFTTIDRCRQALSALEKQTRSDKDQLINLVYARMLVLDFDQGRGFGESV